MMRQTTGIVLALMCAGLAAPTWAEGYPVDKAAQRDLLSTIQGGPKAAAEPTVRRDDAGHIYFVLPSEGAFMEPPARNVTPKESARRFLVRHGKAFGVNTPAVDFELDRVSEQPGRTYVRSDQHYQGIPVFGATATVALDNRGMVAWVVTDLMKNSRVFDTGGVSLAPSVSVEEALTAAAGAVKNDYPDFDFQGQDPKLVVYDPAVLGLDGGPALAWQVDVLSEDTVAVAERVLVDAHTQASLLQISLVHRALERRIYNAGNEYRNYLDTGPLVRSEGDPPLVPEDTWADVNQIYDYFGDTYDYYKDNHGRDSLDNAGLPLEGVANYCDFMMGCPMANAFFVWPPFNRMYFGKGFVTDDVVAHELTHGVTAFTSELVYYGESGAINEMMSDIWAEAVDLTNGAGLDGPAYDWYVGEDTPMGAIRYLADPGQFSNWLRDISGRYIQWPMPDYYKGPGWYEGADDSGGVHHNMSVGTKLFYLVAHGDQFRGFNIDGIGLIEATQLWYQVQLTIPMAADYPALGSVLQAAAQDMRLSGDDQWSLFKALLAVNIVELPEGDPLADFRAYSREGSTSVALTWTPPNYVIEDPESTLEANTVKVLYLPDRFPEGPSDGEVVYQGQGDSALHTGLTAGQDAFYSAFSILLVDGEERGWLERLRTRAIVGDPVLNVLSEPFGTSPAPDNMMDLEFSQILFTPTMDLTGAADSGAPADYVIYSGYEATFKDNVTKLPVPRQKEVFLPMVEDELVELPVFKENTSDERAVVFPYFGRFFSNVFIGENGYIAFEPLVSSGEMYGEDEEDAKFNSPTYANHFEIPRISFLFSDLSHASGGEAWFRYLDDRFVLTYDSVPWRNPDDPNFEDKASTVQVELFYSGHIRMTWLALSAEEAVVGLSDGDGLPRDPAPVFGAKEVYGGLLATDLTRQPAAGGLAITPVPLQLAEEGDTVEFTAQVTPESPTPSWSMTSVGTPLPDEAVLLDEGRTATFTWPTVPGDGGVYQVRVCATAGGKTVCQDVLIFLDDVPAPPAAKEVTLRPQPVARNDDPMVVSYEYTHPRGAPEVGTTINWFRNGSLIPALENRTRLSAEGTKIGDVWRVRVTPVASVGEVAVAVEGEPVFSNEVRVVENLLFDVNFDGAVNATDLQIIINAILGQPYPEGAVPDVNGDGTVNSLDLQIEVLALLGLR